MIISGKIGYVLIWLFFLWNLFFPYQRPANILCNIAFCAMIILHGLQAFLFATTRTQQEKEKDKFAVFRFFLFGVFEVLSWNKKQKKNIQ